MRILWIPHVTWHIPQRAHIFCRALAENHEVHVTDWVADFIRPRDFLTARYLRNFFYRRYQDGDITVHGVPRIAPALFSTTLRRLNTRLFERTVAGIVKTYQIDVVVGTFVVPPPRAPRLIFELFDDNVGYWQSYGRNPDYAVEINAVESAYLKKADAVVAASQVLVEMARKRGAVGPVVWIPNGIELADYQAVSRLRESADSGSVGHAVGVIGNHDKPAELDKVIDVAQILADKDIRFVIAGRGVALPAAQRRVKALKLKNVKFIGPLERRDVPAFLATMDAGLCPYIKTPGADAGSSMRILQYAAAGVPTVCTKLNEVERMGFENVLLVEDTAAAFAQGVLRALKMAKARPAQIINYELSLLSARYEAVLSGAQ